MTGLGVWIESPQLQRSQVLTNVANPETAKVTEEGGVRDECGDENECKEWSGPCWHATRANANIS